MKVRFLSVAGLKMLSNKPVNVATDHSLFFFFFKFHTVIFVALAFYVSLIHDCSKVAFNIKVVKKLLKFTIKYTAMWCSIFVTCKILGVQNENVTESIQISTMGCCSTMVLVNRCQ